ncbi:hypothetical protein L211DRAFT_895448 [Terfezia boudieri ATCC MYA-4762]|uniref:Uncharacterized protein n=1 Tax=Terfezia boudieri ATCC MYA-4762 TaxID=1051890 RepID=A0A3N4LAU0_9PEZI|nr:hypothetical protein L211DRAFT_895448 [Terfezia boudieri ATCC MYA-4762]
MNFIVSTRTPERLAIGRKLLFAPGIGEFGRLPTLLVCFWVWEVMRTVRDAYSKKQDRARANRERAQMLEQLPSLKATQDRQAEELRLVEGRMGRSKAVAHRKLDAHEGRKMFSEVEKVLESQSLTLNNKFEEIRGAFAKGLADQEARLTMLNKEFDTLTKNRLVEQDQNLKTIHTLVNNRFADQDTRIETALKESTVLMRFLYH